MPLDSTFILQKSGNVLAFVGHLARKGFTSMNALYVLFFCLFSCLCFCFVLFSFKTFQTNQTQVSGEVVFRQTLPVPLPAQYIRFHPTNQIDWNCMRVEVYASKFLNSFIHKLS